MARARGMQPLTQQLQVAVPATRQLAGIANQPGKPGSQTASAVLFSHQHHHAVAGDRSDLAPFAA